METNAERQILERWARRESNQAHALCTAQYGRRILSFLTKKLNDGADAEDAYADFTLALWTALEHDAPPAEGELTPLVYRLASTIRRRKLRSKIRKVMRFSPDGPDRVAQPSADGIFRQLEHNERRIALAALRARLTDEERELLTLVADEELSQRDVAAILGISCEAVRARLTRLRVKLRGMNGPS